MIGIADGKEVGTYSECVFQSYFNDRYKMSVGSSVLGIDLPSVNTDIKTITSIAFGDSKKLYTVKVLSRIDIFNVFTKLKIII